MHEAFRGQGLTPIRAIGSDGGGADPIGLTPQFLNLDHVTPSAPSEPRAPAVRKVDPAATYQPAVYVPSSVAPPAAPGFLDRILSFFGRGSGEPGAMPTLVSFADGEHAAKPATPPVTEVVERFERAQEYAAGLALSSSLTQSVLSSSKRLTQGQ